MTIYLEDMGKVTFPFEHGRPRLARGKAGLV